MTQGHCLDPNRVHTYSSLGYPEPQKTRLWTHGTGISPALQRDEKGQIHEEQGVAVFLCDEIQALVNNTGPQVFSFLLNDRSPVVL